jgi:hypothetical protein
MLGCSCPYAGTVSLCFRQNLVIIFEVATDRDGNPDVGVFCVKGEVRAENTSKRSFYLFGQFNFETVKQGLFNISNLVIIQ